MGTCREYRIVLAVLVLAISGCGGGDSNSAPEPAPEPVIETRTVDLFDYVGNTLGYVQAFSDGYSVPTASELDRFDALVISLMDQNLQIAQTAAADIGYRLLRIIDSGAGDNELYCLEEISLSGRGFYCLDFGSARTHHISAPHPLFDGQTNTESVTVMRSTGAHFLSLSTTHRCSNAETSSCSGTTSVCGPSGAYKVSDVAHTVDSFFYRFGKIVHDRSASTHTIQLHGCGSTACPSNMDDSDIVARVSAGTTEDLAATELVNRLNAALNEELSPFQLGSSVSCSEPSMDKRLCGTTNTLARYINGQSDPCRNSASSFVGSRWLHIEQNANIRRDDGAGDSVTPDTLINAINDSLNLLSDAGMSVAAPAEFSLSDDEILEKVRGNAARIYLEQASFTLPESFHDSELPPAEKARLIRQWANDSANCHADALARYATANDVPLSELVSGDGTYGFGFGVPADWEDDLLSCLARTWEAIGASFF